MSLNIAGIIVGTFLLLGHISIAADQVKATQVTPPIRKIVVPTERINNLLFVNVAIDTHYRVHATDGVV